MEKIQRGYNKSRIKTKKTSQTFPTLESWRLLLSKYLQNEHLCLENILFEHVAFLIALFRSRREAWWWATKIEIKIIPEFKSPTFFMSLFGGREAGRWFWILVIYLRNILCDMWARGEGFLAVVLTWVEIKTKIIPISVEEPAPIYLPPICSWNMATA